MHQHRVAEGLIDDHPLLSSFAGFLKRRELSPTLVSFAERCLFFAYPRTVWLKLSANRLVDIKSRHDLYADGFASAFNEWLTRRRAFSTLVFDLRSVTILDLEHIRQLFHETRKGMSATYYLCDPGLADTIKQHMSLSDDVLFLAEQTLLTHLRNAPQLRRCIVRLPCPLTMTSFDFTLRRDAAASRLNHDVLVLDMQNVVALDFQALSMIAPLIHSVAHRHGILTSVVNARRKVARTLAQNSVLRVVQSYLLERPPDYTDYLASTAYPDSTVSGLDLKAFTDDELMELQDAFRLSIETLFRQHASWFTAKARVMSASGAPTHRDTGKKRLTDLKIERMAVVMKSLQQLVKELVENVAIHAHGLGYLMMEFDPQRRLHIYVGDTGVGLAKGLARAYFFKSRSDARAVEIALSLKDMRDKRRRLSGTLLSGGRGLDRVGLILQDLAGHVWIRSGGAMGLFTPGKSRRPSELRRNVYNIQGTHVHILIPRSEDGVKQ